jgi:hypothetical protein
MTDLANIVSNDHVWLINGDRTDDRKLSALNPGKYRYIQLHRDMHKDSYVIQFPNRDSSPMDLQTALQTGTAIAKDFGWVYQQPDHKDYAQMGVSHPCDDCGQSNLISLPAWMYKSDKHVLDNEYLRQHLRKGSADRVRFVLKSGDSTFKHVRAKRNDKGILMSTFASSDSDRDFCSDSGTDLIEAMSRVDFLMAYISNSRSSNNNWKVSV